MIHVASGECPSLRKSRLQHWQGIIGSSLKELHHKNHKNSNTFRSWKPTNFGQKYCRRTWTQHKQTRTLTRIQGEPPRRPNKSWPGLLPKGDGWLWNEILGSSSGHRATTPPPPLPPRQEPAPLPLICKVERQKEACPAWKGFCHFGQICTYYCSTTAIVQLLGADESTYSCQGHSRFVSAADYHKCYLSMSTAWIGFLLPSAHNGWLEAIYMLHGTLCVTLIRHTSVGLHVCICSAKVYIGTIFQLLCTTSDPSFA